MLWFHSNLSKVTCLLITTRGIPYNVIEMIINMEGSQRRQCALASEALGLPLENVKGEQRLSSEGEA